MIITMDGPSASGKSTLARLLAAQLGYLYINSGLLFRAVAYIIHSERESVDQVKLEELISILAPKKFQYHYTPEQGEKIVYEGQFLNPHLKTPLIDHYASLVAEQIIVRQELLDYQRELANSYSLIADGRDCGTVVFPEAQYKFYITASLEVRAKRLKHDQQQFSLQECEEAIQQRDDRDSKRAIAPLKPAEDALVIDTTHMTINEALSTLMEIVEQKS